MKKCPNCNFELPDEALFCNNCGTNLSQPAQPSEPPVMDTPIIEPTNNQTLEAAKAQSKNTKIGIIAIAGVAALAVIILLVILVNALGGGYKKPINSLIKNINSRSTNVESYIDSFAPKFVNSTYKSAISILKSTSKDAYNDYNDAVLEAFEDEFFDELEDDYGDDFKVSIEYKKVKKIDKKDLDDYEDAWEKVGDMLSDMDIDDDDIYDDLSDVFDEEYDAEISSSNQKKLVKLAEKLIDDCESVKVSEGYHVEAKITIKGSEDKETEKLEFDVLKVNGKWIIDVTSYAGMIKSYL